MTESRTAPTGSGDGSDQPEGPETSSRLALAVVVLNYRTPDLVLDCLDSLRGQVEPGRDEVLVVDNASGDGSADTIETELCQRGYGGWARVVRSPDNDGFSAGNNVGLTAVQAELYVLLNSDTIVQPGAVEALRGAARANPDAGLIGPRLEWPDGEAQVSAFRRHSPWSQLIDAAQTGFLTRWLRSKDVSMGVFDEPIEPDWVSFACVAVPGQVVERVGPMDDGFFMYFEDAEYARRVRRAGLRVVYWPEARVVHLRGGSAPVKSQVAQRKRLPEYYYRARSRYFALAGGRVYLLLANLAWTFGWLLSMSRKLTQGRRIGTPRYAPRDIWTGFWSPLKPFRPGGAKGTSS